MSERQAKDWHKMRKRGSVPAYTRPPSLVSLIASNRVIWAPAGIDRRAFPTHGNNDFAQVRKITLPRVKWVEDFDKKYDEKGNPR